MVAKKGRLKISFFVAYALIIYAAYLYVKRYESVYCVDTPPKQHRARSWYSTYVHILRELNDEQQAAVVAAEGPLLIIAGPGTGKTKTLTERMAHLIGSEAARPEEILALTFTKKAAEEMRQRMALFQQDARPEITTFHSLCHALLSEEQHDPLVFVNEQERLAIIKGLSKPAVLKGFSSRELGLLISRAKNSPERAEEAIHKITTAYNQTLAERGFHDFDDLLLQVYKLLRSNTDKRAKIQARYRYILVDEFQDTNRLQYELLLLLRSNDNIAVIGDPFQSIYGFRGASGDIFDRFCADFADVQKITLHVNYRSTAEIVALSNAIFTNREPLVAHQTNPGQVRCIEVLNEYSEAQWVLSEVQRAIGGSDLTRAVSDDTRETHRTLRDFAVVYRSRSAAIALHKAFAESGLPYQIIGDGSPYDRPDIMRLIALLRARVTGELDTAAGLTKAECQTLLQKIPESLDPAQAAMQLAAALGLEITQDLQHFLGTLVRFADIASAVRYFDDIAEKNFYDPNADMITLMTIHASKGLEFPHVFVLAAEEGVLPSGKGDVAEEQRLFYVAVTRAKFRLDILHAKKRGGQLAEISRFIQKLPEAALPRTIDENLDQDLRRLKKRVAKRSQQSLF